MFTLKQTLSNKSSNGSCEQRQQQQQQSLTMTTNTVEHEIAPCAVCDVETSECSNGVPACCACKKFFLRNKHHVDQLTCSSGKFNCNVSRVFNSKQKSNCRKCRLLKSFAVGLSSPSSSMPPQPHQYQQQQKELQQPQQQEEVLRKPKLEKVHPNAVVEGSTASTSNTMYSLLEEQEMLARKMTEEATMVTSKVVESLRQLVEDLEKVTLEVVPLGASKASIWRRVALEFCDSSTSFLNYANRLPSLENERSYWFVDCFMRNVYAGLKALSVVYPLKQRSFISCFQRCNVAGLSSVAEVKVMDECTRLIEGALALCQPTKSHLAVLMALHTYKTLMTKAEYSNAENRFGRYVFLLTVTLEHDQPPSAVRFLFHFLSTPTSSELMVMMMMMGLAQFLVQFSV